ncbi:zinc-binding alcohol dehydrogenase family protein [Sphingobacterium ginsenosidimutans]|uniref:Alcohol dehydrogenase-like N-terminal domain-containing protein n=1 Tax=Sphingobacterium ginsenosidimutans TaxID=687845 RepID=A0ABP7ZRR1_9SPHI
MKGVALLSLRAFEKLPDAMKDLCVFNTKGEFYAMYSEHFDNEVFNRDVDKDFVLVKRLSFSVNYRDKTLVFNRLSFSDDCFFFFGSDFCGQVLEVGESVADFKIGDLVIGDNSYNPNEAFIQGIPSSNCSKEIEKLHKSKLFKICKGLSPTDAAVLSVNVQTAFNIYRNLGFPSGKLILITSGRSQVSLYLLQLLSRENSVTVVCSCGDNWSELLPGLQFKIVFKDSEENSIILEKHESFDIIFDPFINQNLPQLLYLLRFSGTYVFCGLNPFLEEECKMSINMFSHMIKNKINLLGQCLGESIDLSCAIEEYKNNRITAFSSQVYKADNLAEFLDDSWNHKSGIGRPVFLF